MAGKHRIPNMGVRARVDAALGWLRDRVPAEARGKIHAAAPALSVLLVSVGGLTEHKAAAWVAVAVFVADHLLSALHAESRWRQALYPGIATVAGGLVAYGALTQDQASQVLGLAAAVLGSAGAAWLTPRRS